MRLVKLTRCDGTEIWLNPIRVLYVEASREIEGLAKAGSDVHYSNGPDDWERVIEPPQTVAGLLLEPLR